jgi:Ala-tRNA(Pro) deacylase
LPILTKLRQYLDEQGVAYEALTHPPAFTAQEVAQAQHVPGRELAKVVIVKAGTRFVMAVLPALRKLDVAKLAAALPEGAAALATEKELAPLFPGCEPGSMPPFGNLFGLPVYVDRGLAEDETIVFEAGTYTDTVRMRYGDFARLVQPTVGDFALTREEL